MLIDAHMLIGLLSLFGCLCMLCFCGLQVAEMLQTLRPAKAPVPVWEISPTRHLAREGWRPA